MRTRTCCLLMVMMGAATARAQDNSAAVEALFGEGKRLVSEGKLAEACPKFLASYNLEHRIGTLLNLADCYEKNNQIASAWARFVEARTLAARNNQSDRADFAAQHAATLAPKLSKLTITVMHPAPDLSIKQDGVIVEPGAYGVAMAVDSGSHTIEASAPDHKSWTSEITIGANADTKTLDVPELVALPKALRSGTVEKSHALSGRGVTGIVIAAVGLVGVGVGATFGALALSKNGDASQYCNVGGQKDDCYAPGVLLRSDAVTFGNVSTGLLIGGAVLAGAGLVLWLTAPSQTKARVGFDGHMFLIEGKF